MNSDESAISPAQARQRFRDGQVTPTAGWSAGYAQANLIAVPRDYAFDVLLFAQRNPKPCPVLDVLEPGQYAGPMIPGGDIRTDIPAYRIYVDGELVTVCEDNPPYPVSLACIFPHKRLQDPKSRLFIDFMVAAIKQALAEAPTPASPAAA